MTGKVAFFRVRGMVWELAMPLWGVHTIMREWWRWALEYGQKNYYSPWFWLPTIFFISMALVLHMAQIERLPLPLDFSLWQLETQKSSHGPINSSIQTTDPSVAEHVTSISSQIFLEKNCFRWLLIHSTTQKKKCVKSLPRKWARKWAGECLCLSWAAHRLGWHTPKAWLEGVMWGTSKNGSHCRSTQPLGSQGGSLLWHTCMCIPPSPPPPKKQTRNNL